MNSENEKQNKEFFIEATSCEEADIKLAQVIKKIWYQSVENFAKAQTDVEKRNIVQVAIRRGCIPFHLNCNDEKSVYNEMEKCSFPKKVGSHHNVAIITSAMTLQKN